MSKKYTCAGMNCGGRVRGYADGGAVRDDDRPKRTEQSLPVAKDKLGRTIPADFIPPAQWERAVREKAPIVRMDSLGRKSGGRV